MLQRRARQYGNSTVPFLPAFQSLNQHNSATSRTAICTFTEAAPPPAAATHRAGPGLVCRVPERGAGGQHAWRACTRRQCWRRQRRLAAVAAWGVPADQRSQWVRGNLHSQGSAAAVHTCKEESCEFPKPCAGIAMMHCCRVPRPLHGEAKAGPPHYH